MFRPAQDGIEPRRTTCPRGRRAREAALMGPCKPQADPCCLLLDAVFELSNSCEQGTSFAGLGSILVDQAVHFVCSNTREFTNAEASRAMIVAMKKGFGWAQHTNRVGRIKQPGLPGVY